MKPIFRVGWQDLLRGLIVVVLATLWSLPVDVLSNWLPFLKDPHISMIVAVILGYLSKNLATDAGGSLGGRIKIY